MKKIGIFIGLIMILVLVAGCERQPRINGVCTLEAKICPDGSSVGRTGPNCEFAPCPEDNAGIANPASVYCEEQGGTLQIVTAADGSQSGLCKFSNGKECDEWAFYRGECKKEEAGVEVSSTPPLNIYSEADVVAEVLQPFIVNGETTKHLSIKITKIEYISGKPLIQEEDIINPYVSGIEDLGCKDLNGDGAVTVPGECINKDNPEKIYADWNVVSFKTGDIIKLHLRCSELEESTCSFWEADDSKIIMRNQSQNLTIVKQSGGAAMLDIKCANQSYITETADYIVEGTVKNVESKWNENKTSIFTYSDLLIEKYLKGTPFENNLLQIITPGGTVGDISQWVEEQPIFHEGKKVRVYLKKTNGEFSIVCARDGIEEI